jgi:hypothetical protein
MDRLGVRGGVYIGVGPDQNFTYMARVRPRMAFLVDIRRDNMLQHLLFKALFASAANRAEYLALWTGRPLPTPSAAFAARPITTLVAWIDSARATPASIERAKRVVREQVQRTGLALSADDLATIADFTMPSSPMGSRCASRAPVVRRSPTIRRSGNCCLNTMPAVGCAAISPVRTTSSFSSRCSAAIWSCPSPAICRRHARCLIGGTSA